ncbi:Os09g0131075 [Oryza sativa Japonica Group]|uniref:Uncharacterized protein n=2 Tax=Oryza sativa subsp. japonica TaxID=39947 RepID=A0A8J8Y268_ORYSJ|nr:hypothetical protein OsJ_28446 [Oryza sativa Japonica Group]BAT06944.1 Os09g0131075 [Oryza sativa Japonica Group]
MEPITVTVVRTDRDAAVKQSHSPPPPVPAAMMTGEGNKLVFLDNAPEAVRPRHATVRGQGDRQGRHGDDVTTPAPTR